MGDNTIPCQVAAQKAWSVCLQGVLWCRALANAVGEQYAHFPEYTQAMNASTALTHLITQGHQC